MDLALIEQWPLVRFIATAPGAYPVLSALHILGIALTVGPILLVDLRLIGLIRTAGIEAAVVPLARASAIGLSLAVLTGIGLASVQITKYVVNGPFALKLCLLALAVGNALALRRAARPARWDALIDSRRARFAGLASLLLWLSVILAGRWIAFV